MTRLRWGVRGVLALGVAVSVTANVLHAQPNGISRVMAGWPPVALLLTIDLIARVPVRGRLLATTRLLAALGIAGIVAWISYWHMVAVALRYGETGLSAYLLPLSADGLIVVASICLVELGSRTGPSPVEGGTDEPERQPVGTDSGTTRPAAEVQGVRQERRGALVSDAGPAARPEMPVRQDDEEVAAPVRRRPTPRPDVAAAHRKNPVARHEEIAAKLGISAKTVERHRALIVSDNVSDTPQVNGKVPELR